VSAADVHAVVPTHTTRHLALTLAGLARQSVRPTTIVVSCDTDDASIGEVVARACRSWGAQAWWVRRASHGEERLCQVRNNAVRLLRERGARDGRVLVLDGDMVACADAVSLHRDLGRRARLVLPYRIDVPEARTAELDADRLAAGNEPLEPTPEDLAYLRGRDRRYRKHLRMRRLRLGPRHKPKLLGGHFSCDLRLYLRLNGFDELYRGWGFKDDEFAYRAARLGATAAPACEAIPAWHLYHRTRQPDVPMRELPTARRFERRRRLPVACEHGVDNPLPQHAVRATLFGPGGETLAETASGR
jgi:hypothetical protein